MATSVPSPAEILESFPATPAKIDTQHTAKAITKLLNYCATNPNAAIQYKSSDMILRVHSDTSYLTEPKARSRAGGFFYMGNTTEISSTAPFSHQQE